MGEFEGHERREYQQPCSMLIDVSKNMSVTNMKIDDFIERYERDQDVARNWRGNVENGITKLTEALGTLNQTIRDMNRPYTVMKWVGAVIIAGFLTAGGVALFEFLKLNFR